MKRNRKKRKKNKTRRRKEAEEKKQKKSKTIKKEAAGRTNTRTGERFARVPLKAASVETLGRRVERERSDRQSRVCLRRKRSRPAARPKSVPVCPQVCTGYVLYVFIKYLFVVESFLRAGVEALVGRVEGQFGKLRKAHTPVTQKRVRHARVSSHRMYS